MKDNNDNSNTNNDSGLNRRDFVKATLGVAAGMIVQSLGTASANSLSVDTPEKHALLINTHQFYKGISEGRLNETLMQIMRNELESGGYIVNATNIEKGYDINREVQKHLDADIIIVQSPVYWFGAPWIYKKYIDEVFTRGMIDGVFLTGDGRSDTDPTLQYGTGGKLGGKKFMLSLTMNSPEKAFNDTKQVLHRGASVEELFHGVTSVYKFCGADIVPEFSSFDVIKNPHVPEYISGLKQHLHKHFI